MSVRQGDGEADAVASMPQDRAQPDALEQARLWLARHGADVPARAVDGEDQAVSGRHGTARWVPTARPGSVSAASGEGRAGQADSCPEPTEARRDRSTPADGAAAGSGSDDDEHGDPVAVARTIVLRKLAAQARTRAELRKALEAKHVPADASESVLDRMEAVGLVDDAEFAQDWVTSRQQRRHLSRYALRRELVTKGVADSHIEAALEQVDDLDELAAARRLAAKKMASLVDQERQVQYRRLAGVLGRRGFSSSVISRVVSETLTDAEELGGSEPL